MIFVGFKRKEIRYSAKFPFSFKLLNSAFLFGEHFTLAEDTSGPDSSIVKEHLNVVFPDFSFALNLSTATPCTS